LCGVLYLSCSLTVRAADNPTYALTLSMYNDPLCTSPSSFPAVSLDSFPTPLVSSGCSTSPGDLAQQGYPLYRAMCSNTTDALYYTLFLYLTTAAGCSMTNNQSTVLWSLRNENGSGSCTQNTHSVYISPGNTSLYTRYSKWSCVLPNSASMQYSTVLVTPLLMGLLWLLTVV